jgi:LPS-assembly lipoprotein
VPARRLLVLAVLLLVGACGFRPLLKQQAEVDRDQEVLSELAAVEVERLGGQLGQQLRNDLIDQLDPATLQMPKRYELDVSLRTRTNALAIQLDNTITRYNLTLRARFQLRDKEDGEVLYRSGVTRTSSYNVVRQPYAVLVAEDDAERRAAREVSADIRNLLAVYFAEGPALEAGS